MVTAEDIIALRKFRDWSQSDLGAEVGVTQTTISRFENGAPVEGPARKILAALVDAFRKEEAAKVAAE